MSAWATRAAELDLRAQDVGRFESVQDDALALVNERLDAERLRGQVWGSWIYACDRCGYRERYELEVGVEGPPFWRFDLTYIACAFTAGRCESCGQPMTHVDWKRDVSYPEPRPMSARRVFRVPREWPVHPTQGMRDDGTVITGKASSAFLSLNLNGREISP